MKLLVTGSDGFIGKNLKIFLKEKGHKIIEFTRFDSIDELKNKISRVEAIFHLAGVNRTNKSELFREVNVNLTNLICNYLIEKEIKVPIFFSSSIHALHDNEYGKSKREAEKILHDLALNNKNPIFIYRLPGVFGKWCRPNYNSVVATFCYNTANNLSLKIKSDQELNLVYIDDLIADYHNKLKEYKVGCNYYEITPQYKISISKLAEYIKQFKGSREDLLVDSLGNGFLKKLYATYLSYTLEKDFSYGLTKNTDKRGDFIEIIKSKESGQISYFTAHPGITRGGHYHNTKCEKFFVIHGKAKFKFKNIISNKCWEKISSDNSSEIIESIPGWSHNITNIGEEELKVLVWSSELFDQNNPDTYWSKI